MLEGMADLLREQRLPPLPQDVDPREFPQNDEVWQAGFFHMPTMISNEEVGVEQEELTSGSRHEQEQDQHEEAQKKAGNVGRDTVP